MTVECGDSKLRDCLSGGGTWRLATLASAFGPVGNLSPRARAKNLTEALQ